MLRRFPASRPLTRKFGIKAARPLIVIVCEGRITEPYYFRDFKNLHGNGLVTVHAIGGCGVPDSVVERAIEEKENLRGVARKSKDSFESLYEVWAAFDRDDHPNDKVLRAMELARGNGINLAYSNPCFEVWGLMHFSCYAKPGHHHEVQQALKTMLTNYCHEKNPVLDVSSLAEKYNNAVRNSENALKNRYSEGIEGGNPSTTVHLLTERIRSFGR